MIQTLSSDDPCPFPADSDGAERTEGWQIDLGLREIETPVGVEMRRRCEILPADYDEDGCPDGAADCTAHHFYDSLQGWFVDADSRDCEIGEMWFTTPSITDVPSYVALECRLDR